MEDRDQVKLNFRLVKEVDDLLVKYEAQTGIKMADVVRQVCSDWVDSTVRLRGSVSFGSQKRRTGVSMPRLLANALSEKIEPLKLTRGDVISRLVYNYLVGRVADEQPSRIEKDDPELLLEALRRLRDAAQPHGAASPDLQEALALASDLLGEELNAHDRPATGPNGHRPQEDSDLERARSVCA